MLNGRPTPSLSHPSASPFPLAAQFCNRPLLAPLRGSGPLRWPRSSVWRSQGNRGLLMSSDFTLLSRHKAPAHKAFLRAPARSRTHRLNRPWHRGVSQQGYGPRNSASSNRELTKDRRVQEKWKARRMNIKDNVTERKRKREGNLSSLSCNSECVFFLSHPSFLSVFHCN